MIRNEFAMKQQYSEYDDRFASYYNDVMRNLEKEGKATYKNYMYSMSVYYTYLSSIKGREEKRFLPSHFSTDFLSGFLLWQKNRGIVESSCNTNFANIRAVLKRISLIDRTFHYLYLDALSIQKLKEKNKDNGILEDHDLKEILKCPGLTTLTGIRYTAMFSFMATSGPRTSEVLTLKIKNLDLTPDKAYAEVIGKGKKKRVVPIANQVIPILTMYIKAWHGSHPNPEAYLFFSPRSSPFVISSREGVYRQLKKYAIAALGADKGKRVHPHLLRHTAATKWVEHNLSYPQVSKILGHAYLSTTKEYVSISQKTIEESLNQVKRLSIKNNAKKMSSLHEFFDDALKILG